MTMAQRINYLTSGMRWIARALGLLADGLFVLFVLCSGVEILPRLSQSSPRGLPLFIVLTLTAASVPIACRWELIGGLMAVLGAVALNALVYFGSGRAVFSTALMISSPFFIVGGLFLVCRWRTRQAQRQQTPESVGLSRAKAELEPAVTDMVPETVKQAV